MNIFSNRPLSFLCFIFIALSAAGFYLGGAVKIAAGCVVLIALFVFTVLRLRKKIMPRRFAGILLASLFALSSLSISYGYFDMYYADMQKYSGQACEIHALITEVEYSGEYFTGYSAKLRTVNGEEQSGKVIIECEYPAAFKPGYEIKMTAEGRELTDDSYGYSQKRSRISDGIIFSFFSETEETVEIVSTERMSAEIFFGRLMTESSVRLSRSVGGEAGRLASALVLADKSGLSDETELDFARSGVSHILALSGLHMSVIALLLERLMRRFYIPKTLRSVFLSVGLILYLALTGFTVSAVRSVLMVTAVVVSYIFRGHSDPRTALFCACALILTISPYSVADAGFWMSFLATFGIITVSPYTSLLFSSGKKSIGRLRRLFSSLLSAVIITLTANISVIFLTWLCFGELSLAAPLVNLAATPLTAVIIASAMIYFATRGLWMSEAAAFVCRKAGELVLAVTDRVSEIKGVTVSLKYDFAAVIICLFAAATAILLVVRLRDKRKILIAPAAAVLSFAVCLVIHNAATANRAEVTYINDKNNEMLVISETGGAVVCDVSDGRYSRLSVACTAALKSGATEIDALVLTHYHSHHLISVEKCMQNFKLRRLILPEPHNSQEVELFEGLCRTAAAENAVVVLYERGTELSVSDNSDITVFPYEMLDRSVHPCIGLTIDTPESSLTYAGAAYFESDGSDYAHKQAGGSSVLIVGAHNPLSKNAVEYFPTDENTVILIGNDSVFTNLRLPAESKKRIGIIHGAEIIKFELSD